MDTMHSELDTEFDRRVITRLLTLSIANYMDVIMDQFLFYIDFHMKNGEVLHGVMNANTNDSSEAMREVMKDVWKSGNSQVNYLSIKSQADMHTIMYINAEQISSVDFDLEV